MAPKPPLGPAQLKLLRDDLDLIHLLFHRNKNQHRILRWWQWIGTLKRNLTKLLSEHDLITAAKTTPNRNAAVQKYQERVVFMRKVVVPSAYTAFGSVIAMKNFAPLGMVLMGVLARVWKILRPSEKELEAEREAAAAAVDAAEADMDAELGVVISREGYGAEEGGVVISRAEYESEAGAVISRSEYEKTTNPKENKRVRSSGEDRGETGSSTRKEIESEAPEDPPERIKVKRSKTSEALQGEASKTKRKPSAEGDKKKKKKKKKNDIDDLFSGLF